MPELLIQSKVGELPSNKERSTDLRSQSWPPFLHCTCSSANCLPCWASGWLCNAVNLPHSVWHTCSPADPRSWAHLCWGRQAGRQQTGQNQQHHCQLRPQQTWGWGVTSCLWWTTTEQPFTYCRSLDKQIHELFEDMWIICVFSMPQMQRRAWIFEDVAELMDHIQL